MYGKKLKANLFPKAKNWIICKKIAKKKEKGENVF